MHVYLYTVLYWYPTYVQTMPILSKHVYISQVCITCIELVLSHILLTIDRHPAYGAGRFVSSIRSNNNNSTIDVNQDVAAYNIVLCNSTLRNP